MNFLILSILISCRQSVLNTMRLEVHVQVLLFSAHAMSDIPRDNIGGTTHLELAPILTVSLICSRVGLAAGASFLPPPMASIERPTVPKMVPRARYSFLMARPRITLFDVLVRIFPDRLYDENTH